LNRNKNEDEKTSIPDIKLKKQENPNEFAINNNSKILNKFYYLCYYICYLERIRNDIELNFYLLNINHF